LNLGNDVKDKEEEADPGKGDGEGSMVSLPDERRTEAETLFALALPGGGQDSGGTNGM
jgi:hypothetical protein